MEEGGFRSDLRDEKNIKSKLVVVIDRIRFTVATFIDNLYRAYRRFRKHRTKYMGAYMAKHMSSNGNGYKPKDSAQKRSTPSHAHAGSGQAPVQNGYVGYTNEVQRVKNAKNPKKKGGIRPWHVILIIVVLALVVVGVNGALLYRDVKAVKADADTLMSEVSTMKDAVKNGDGDTLKQTASEVGKLASEMNATVQSPWWVAAEFIPVYGQDVAQGRVLLSTLDSMSTNVIEPLANTMAGVKLGDLISDGTINIEILRTIINAVDDVKQPLQESMDVINAMQPFHIEKLESTMAQVKEKLSVADTFLEESDKILPYLPGMLGADGQTQTYLIVAMNNVETRTLSGLSGSMGTMTVTDGKMEIGEFSAYSDPLYDVMSGVSEEEKNVFTNGYETTPGSFAINPDFPRAAQRYKEMYAIKTGVQVNGVVAVNTVFLQSLIGLTGPVDTSWGLQLTGDNAAKVIMSDAYALYDTKTQDVFFGAVASECFDHIFSNLGNANVVDLVETMANAFEKNDFMAWSENENYEGAIKALGAAAELSTDEAKPVLGVYTTDYTWSKIDWYLDVNTTIGEGVKNADGSTTYQVTTVMTNKMTQDEMYTLDEYVTGYNQLKRDRSDIVTMLLLFAPAGGSIDNVTASGGVFSSQQASVYGFDVEKCMTQQVSGESTTITYTVTTSPNATEPLTLRETPQAREFS